MSYQSIAFGYHRRRRKKSKTIGKDIKILGLQRRSSFPHSPTHNTCMGKKKKKKKTEGGGLGKCYRHFQEDRQVCPTGVTRADKIDQRVFQIVTNNQIHLI